MALAKGEAEFLHLEPRRGSRFGSVLITYRTTALGALDFDTDDLKIYGRLIKVVRNPTDAHTASWEFALNDEDGISLIDNDACSATNTEVDEPALVNTYFLPVFKGALNMVIGAAGDGVNGVAEVFYER